MNASHQPSGQHAAHLLAMGLDASLGTQARAFAPGDRVDGYRLIAKLGEGGFGVVWRAEQTEPIKREVALKILRPGVDVVAAEERFRMESHALARMNHPGIAAVLDMNVLPGGQPYFVMELVHGEPITRYVEAHQLDLRQRLRLMVEVCHAVQHAHQRAVLHRDLKPSNILVTEVDGQPVPKVIDFGIAKALSDEATGDLTLAVTAKGMMLGTPQYMAPEQAAFSSEGADARADVYALGVVLFELIAGVTPIGRGATDAISLPSLLKRVCEEEAPRPSALVRAQPERCAPVPKGVKRRDLEELDWLVLKALEKRPDDRYASAAALADDLQHFLNQEALSVGPPGMAYRINKLVQRNKAPVAAGLFVIVGIGISAFISFKAYLDESVAHRRAEQMSLQAHENARLALRQSARADDALAIMSGVLQEAGKQIKSGENATALRAGLKSAEAALSKSSDQPELELTMAREIAAAYEAMGDDRQALPLRERALALLTTLRGADDPETLEALELVAESFYETGRHRDAVPLYRQLIDAWKAKGEQGRRSWFDASLKLAGALNVMDSDHEAMAVLNSLRDEKDGAGNVAADNPSFARAYAEVQVELGDLAGARATLEKWLASSEGSDKSRRRRSMMTVLARIEVKERDYVRAAGHFLEVVKMQQHDEDATKSDSIDVMIEAARAYRRGRQMEQAIKVMDEAEELAIKADNLKQVLHCLTARATIFDDEKHYAEAAQAYARFLALARVPENASSKSWLSAVMSLSRCYKLLERYDEGRALAVTAWQQLDTLGSLEGLWGLAASVLEYNIKHCERWQAKTGSNVMADELVRWRERLAEYRALAKKHGLDEP